MKKKSNEEILIGKAKHHPSKDQFPFDETLSAKEKRPHILEGAVSDLKIREIFDEQFSPRVFFEKHAPKSKKLDHNSSSGTGTSINPISIL